VRPLLVPALAIVAVGVLVGVHGDEVSAALGHVPARDAVALAALHLLALMVRAEAWALCVRRAGGAVPRRELHLSSSLRFAADTIVPTYVGLFVRVALLRRWLGERAPTIGQMVAADGVMLVIEGVIVLGLLIAVTPTVGLSWWWALVGGAALAAGLVLAKHVRRRWAHRSFTSTLENLDFSVQTARLSALLFVVVAVQPVRFAVALHAVKVNASAIESLFAFIATNIFGALPIGPGPSSIAGLATALPADTGRLTAAGLLLSATAIVAAGTYSAGAGAVAALRRPVPAQ
jgi:uncharacterized membrane protein YbhN (UPF0104 family)